MQGDQLLACDSCGQMFLVRVEILANMNPCVFCPVCGTRSLQVCKSAISGIFKARCFAGFDPMLAQLLYAAWRKDGTDEYPRFVDYIKFRLEEED